jgi:hypothetical protein
VLLTAARGRACQQNAGARAAERRWLWFLHADSRLVPTTLPALADKRATDPKRLSHAVQGELDWIIQKAIDKDRARRYDTALGLALDIRRHLDGDAVLAAPPSTAYRMRKFVSRHRGAAAAAAVITLALILGLIGTLWQASVAARQRMPRESSCAGPGRHRLRRRSLKSSDPTQQGRTDTTVADAMRQAASRLNAGGLARARPWRSAADHRVGAQRHEQSTEARPFAEQSSHSSASCTATRITRRRRIGHPWSDRRVTGPFTDADAILTEAIQIRRALVPLNGRHSSSRSTNWPARSFDCRRWTRCCVLSEASARHRTPVHPEGDRTWRSRSTGSRSPTRTSASSTSPRNYLDAGHHARVLPAISPIHARSSGTSRRRDEPLAAIPRRSTSPTRRWR